MNRNYPCISAVIPALNEEKTVAEVVRAAVSSPLVNEVIVVSDGSTDRTAELAQREGARVLRRETPQGKGRAMLHGVKHADGDILLFLDADLKGLTAQHIRQLAKPVVEGTCDMSVGFLPKGPFTRLQFILPVISGQRAIRRDLFEAIPKRFVDGYMVETAMMRYCHAHRKQVKLSVLSGLGVRRKIEKTRLDRAVFQYLSMGYQILKARLLILLARLSGKF